MQIVTLDFETYYDSKEKYSLAGKMNTSEYVRDERFTAQCAAIKVGDGETTVYAYDDIAHALNRIDWKSSALLAHNCAFEGFILSHHYQITPAYYLDTLSMSRAIYGQAVKHGLDALSKRLGLAGKVKKVALANVNGVRYPEGEVLESLMAYCKDDVDDTYEAFMQLRPAFPRAEFDLVNITIRMFAQPTLLIDLPRVEKAYQAEIDDKELAVSNTGLTKDDISKTSVFAQKLRDLGVEPPTKISLTTGKPIYAFSKTDDGLKALLEHEDERVRNLAIARLKVKSTIGETRALRFINARTTLPVLLNFSGAHTHRWSGGNKINLQNLKRKGELRQSILAPPGYQIVVCDSSQIEARVLAWLAGQDDLLQVFANKQDPYKLMAAEAFSKPVDQVTSDERFIGKICVLGLGYGMGAVKFQETLHLGTMGPSVDIPLEQAQNIVRIYRRKNYAISNFWKIADSMITSLATNVRGTYKCLEYNNKRIKVPGNLWLYYPGLKFTCQMVDDEVVETYYSYTSKNGQNKIYGGSLTENIVQYLSRLIIAGQMLEIDKVCRVVSMTHDEIIAIAPTEHAQTTFDYMQKVMATAPAWAQGLILNSEGGYASNYSK